MQSNEEQHNIHAATNNQLQHPIRDLNLLLGIEGEFMVPFDPCFVGAHYVRDFKVTLYTDNDDFDSFEVAHCEVHLMMTAQIESLKEEADEHSAPMYQAVLDMFDGQRLNRRVKSLFGRPKNRNILLVDTLHVDPQYRCMGIGQMLIETIQKLARDVAGFMVAVPYAPEAPQPSLHGTEVELEANNVLYEEHLLRVIRFFQKCGFRVITEDTMIFSTELSEQPSLGEALKVHEQFGS